ncbi:Transmembrane protein 138 [Apodemus speciosus]|uniref:Transmembrane protein 138 n=1 Tax=Apodemus speciosus TaxID=105296 RepID=A0ABQ0FSR0_APOSI
MLQTSNYSMVLSLQFLLLSYDLFVNSFSELLRMAPVIQLVLFIIQDIAILFNIIIIFLMFFNTFVFQAGLVNLLFHKFKGTIILTSVYLALSISLHVWVMKYIPSSGLEEPLEVKHKKSRRWLRAGKVAKQVKEFPAKHDALNFDPWDPYDGRKELTLNVRWKSPSSFTWTDGLQTLFVFQRLAAVLYCYFYKRTAVRLGDPRFYQDSLWLRKEFMQVRR